MARLDIAPGATWLKGYLAPDEQQRRHRARSFDSRWTCGRLRADRSRRWQDARADGVPRAPLESADVSVRGDPGRLRPRAGRARAGRVGADGLGDCARGRLRCSAGYLSDQLVRQRRTHGAAPGQGREPRVDRSRAFPSSPCRSAIRHGSFLAVFGGATRSRRSCSSRATRSSSAGLPGSAITASPESSRVRHRWRAHAGTFEPDVSSVLTRRTAASFTSFKGPSEGRSGRTITDGTMDVSLSCISSRPARRFNHEHLRGPDVAPREGTALARHVAGRRCSSKGGRNVADTYSPGFFPGV